LSNAQPERANRHAVTLLRRAPVKLYAGTTEQFRALSDHGVSIECQLGNDTWRPLQ
jgi:hypothetical protein